MAKKDDLTNSVREFRSKVPSLKEPVNLEFAVGDLHGQDQWTILPENQGVYYFLRATDGEVLYVGKSSGTSLRKRVYSQMTSFGDPKWDSVIKDPGTRVGVFAFDNADWYWALSLEALLIDRIRPEFNKRTG